jgi:hypothetical protein
MKPKNILCGQNVELLNVKVCGIFKSPLCFKYVKREAHLMNVSDFGFCLREEAYTLRPHRQDQSDNDV